MSGSGSGASSRNVSARQRALHSLQKIKDVSKEFFRNLQNVSKAGRDEPGAAEKEETLRSQRDKYVQLLCTFQSQLSDTTRELETAMECKRKMGDMKKKIEVHEAAVRNFGRDLQSAEEVLSGVLRRASATTDDPVEIDVDDLIRFSHDISYSTSAFEGWEPNSLLTGALPPAPHTEMMARSRLFGSSTAAVRPSQHGHSGIAGDTAAADRRVVSPRPASHDLEMEVRVDAAGSERKREREAAQSDDEEMFRLWSHALPSAEDATREEVNDMVGKEEQHPEKRRALVLPLAACLRDSPPKDRQGHERARGGCDTKSESENSTWLQRQQGYLEMPERPKWWRPGMPIVVDK